jgi:purine-binding chemotaxis protein CheW
VTAFPDAGNREAASQETFQLVSFRLGREEYGIEITQVREIILMGEITRLPQTPPHIRGLINLRSNVIPIVDLRQRFGMPPKEPDENTRIVVVGVEGRTIGVIVDAVNEVMRVARKMVSQPPYDIGNAERRYPAQIVQLQGRLIILLEIAAVLSGDRPLPVDFDACEASPPRAC